MASLSSYRTQARALLNEATAGFWLDSELNQWANDAADDIATETKSIQKNVSITTISGTADYAFSTIASDLLWPVIVRFKGRKLQFIDFREQESHQSGKVDSDLTSGTPSFYLIFGSTLTLEPAPDEAATLRVDYYARATSMSADTDTPGLPTHLDRGVVLYMCWRALEKDREGALAGMFQRDYELFLSRARQRMRALQRDRIRTVKDVEDFEFTGFGIS